MTRVAITGHRGLPSDTTALVEAELRSQISARADGELVGVSCIADGPDSLFASAVLEAGGSLLVVVRRRGCTGTACHVNIIVCMTNYIRPQQK
ncbi:hypothetical protein [Nocardia sp. R7R-8]|uniref:hypothetical protein n=1 Tax=Nocardia sp. R7R-8 TaxID=3459304 RepID=UPI00403DC611